MIKFVWPGAWQLDHLVWVVPDPQLLAARVVGCWVLIGQQFYEKLTLLELHAVVQHERGHGLWHGLSRGIVTTVAPKLLPALCRHQELTADDYAKRRGFGKALAAALLKFQHLNQGENYPPVQERVRRLLAC